MAGLDMSSASRAFFLDGGIGVAVATAFFAFAALVPLAGHPIASWIAIIGSFLCPGFLLLASTICYADQAQMTRWGLLSVFGFVAVTNCLLYGAIGAVYVKVRHWGSRTTTA